ncbi:MAG TPA: hypothetical protein VHL59_02505, partial [Thermoanaerobaculia bacterium]|nr:hypothetical protein [Thermoanaerobaculia bacterium]
DRIVACEFATAFPPGSGTVTLQAGLRDTMPADYDPSNDISAPFSIKVYDDLAGIDQWNARAFQSKYSSRWYSRDAWGESESITSGHIADAQFNAQFRSTQPNVETLRASLRLTTDGRILSENHDVWFDFQPGATQQCALAWMGERNNFLRACHFVTTWAGEFTSINFSWATGDVTYVSRGWYAYYVGGPPAYVWYWNHRDIWGNGMELGESVTFELQFSDGTNYWFANPTVPLTTTTHSYGEPLTCWGEAPWQSCFEYGGGYTVKSGSVSGGGQ